MSVSERQESASGDSLALKRSRLLARKISELALVIEGTRIEELIKQLYEELESAGISLRPRVYLSDEWGCPDRVPAIGIPFYLADPELQQLEGELSGVEAENEAEVMLYLRHEMGHAFNYAYRLYAKPEWRQLFGKFSRPYQEDYKASPFSPRFVQHIPGWYAQKHPDEDFAETFAVWLTPGSRWREKYAGTPALAKLLYVERVVRRYGRQPPTVSDEGVDTPLQELTMTLDEWYKSYQDADGGPALPPTIDDDLRSLFPGMEGQPAADVLEAHRWLLIREIFHWTAMDRHTVGLMLNELLQRARFLDLKLEAAEVTPRMMGVSIFVTTLAMNYQRSSKFTEV